MSAQELSCFLKTKFLIGVLILPQNVLYLVIKVCYLDIMYSVQYMLIKQHKNSNINTKLSKLNTNPCHLISHT